jgi:hypothetical protein
MIQKQKGIWSWWQNYKAQNVFIGTGIFLTNHNNLLIYTLK